MPDLLCGHGLLAASEIGGQYYNGGNEQEYCPVAQARGMAGIYAVNEASYVIPGQVPWNGIESEARYHWHHARHVNLEYLLAAQKA